MRSEALYLKDMVKARSNHTGSGSWEFVEIRDPWDVATPIRAALQGATTC